MKEIIEYGVCTAPSDTELVKAVNEAISMGFQPFGNLIVVTNQYNNGTIVQPMVKYAAEKQ